MFWQPIEVPLAVQESHKTAAPLEVAVVEAQQAAQEEDADAAELLVVIVVELVVARLLQQRAAPQGDGAPEADRREASHLRGKVGRRHHSGRSPQALRSVRTRYRHQPALPRKGVSIDHDFVE